MTDAYTVYWPQDLWTPAAAAAAAGHPLRVLFGGRHTSGPSFSRAKVTVGDVIYPVGVRQRTLYILGRMPVEEIRPLTEDEDGDTEGDIGFYLRRYPQWRFLTNCSFEAVLGHGSPVRFDVPVPVDVLRRWTYRSQRRTRALKHLDEDGNILRFDSFHGHVYRLSQETAADVARLSPA